MKRGTRDSMEKARWLRFRLRSLVNLKKKKKKKAEKMCKCQDETNLHLKVYM